MLLNILIDLTWLSHNQPNPTLCVVPRDAMKILYFASNSHITFIITKVVLFKMKFTSHFWIVYIYILTYTYIHVNIVIYSSPFSLFTVGLIVYYERFYILKISPISRSTTGCVVHYNWCMIILGIFGQLSLKY